MNDRELLELAAKAAGIHLTWGGPDKDMPRRTDTLDLWIPHTDDGDALRLAVKLNMCVTSFTDEQMVGYVVNGEGHNVREDPGQDPYAATRRAIVRAAAEVGRQMQEGGAE